MSQENLNDLYHLGDSYLQQGRNDQAAHVYENIIARDPEQSLAYLLLGLIATERGDKQEAADHIRESIRINPDYAEAYYHLGNLFAQQGQNHDAATHYDRAIHINLDYLEAHIGLGNLRITEQDFQGAIECYGHAIRINPDSTIAHFNLGNVLIKTGDTSRAMMHLKRAVLLKPDYVDAWNNLGWAQTILGMNNDAIASYQNAIKTDPSFASAYSNLGTLHKQAENFEEALLCLQQAVTLSPDSAGAYNNLGTVQDVLGQLDEAINSFATSLSLDHTLLAARQNLFRTRQIICDWSGDNTYQSPGIDQNNNDFYNFLPPFQHLTCCDDPGENFLVAKRSALKKHSLQKNQDSIMCESPLLRDHGKLNIGYIGSDFYNHATSHLMVQLFSLHDRMKFHISVFSYGKNDNSIYRAQIEKDTDQFIDLRGASHQQMAEQVRKANIHILIELKGHTINNCLKVCALRPAPIIASWLGFPGTTGADFIDYIITDRVVSPPDEQAFYSEAMVSLPHCYQVTDHKQMIAENQPSRADLNLPETGFVFCSFNGNYKIEPVMFDVWMRLLHQVPHSVLWLLKSNEMAEHNLKKEARNRGISPDRLIFADHCQKDAHLSRMKHADLALDTRICGGHTTTSDALWASVPVITLQGNHFASRVASSILKAIDLSELITTTLDDYESLALQLAQSPDTLVAINMKLEQNKLTTPLFDTPRFVRNLEQGYLLMWEKLLAGKSPERIDVFELMDTD